MPQLQTHAEPPLTAPLRNLERALHPSWRFCTGGCCTPNARNRSCVFGNLLFRPPNRFSYLVDKASPGGALRESLVTYLHNRFANDGATLRGASSRFSPDVVPLAEATTVPTVLEEALFIASDLHGNVAHNYLDMVFPAFSALHRLRGAAAELLDRGAADASIPDGQARDAARRVLRTVPNLTAGTDRRVLYLIYDPYQPRGKPQTWHRGQEERSFAERIFGRVADLPQLVEACPRGCLVRTAVAGVGHTGLCMVDEQNAMAGARQHRALWAYRQRIYAAYRAQLPPIVAPADGVRSKHVVFVRNKRRFENLEELMERVRRLGNIRVQYVRWERMSQLEKLATFQAMDVQVTGVGTAQANTFFMPAGGVSVCLGWRHEKARKSIYYFDSHSLGALDHVRVSATHTHTNTHSVACPGSPGAACARCATRLGLHCARGRQVRVLYYPGYDPWELAPLRPANETGETGMNVRLNLTKATALVAEALALQAAGFAIPVPEGLNSNEHDRWYAELARRSKGVSHRARTGDDALPLPSSLLCWTINSVSDMLWGRYAQRCPWAPWVAGILKDSQL